MIRSRFLAASSLLTLISSPFSTNIDKHDFLASLAIDIINDERNLSIT